MSDFSKRLIVLCPPTGKTYSDGLARGQEKNYISKQIDCDLTAYTLVSFLEGLFGLAKNSQDIKVLKKGRQAFKTYLKSLKP